MQHYDYIVVGAGAAGAVVAARLSEKTDQQVLLVERGPEARSMFVDLPAGMMTLIKDGRLLTARLTEPEPFLTNRQLPLLEGRACGGGTVVNGMGYLRGHKADYDGWAAGGATGWAYDDVLPYFLKSERHAHRRDSPFHSVDGPLDVRISEPELSPFPGAFLEAGAEAGFPLTDDFNGAHQTGFGQLDCTVRGGKRASTASAFLATARKRPNLTIMTDTNVLGIVFEDDRAVGIRASRGGDEFEFGARGEVVLCGGAYSSPHLLMLAGIGPAQTLRQAGIAVRVDRQGVGTNLQNHVDAAIRYANRQPISLRPFLHFPRNYLAGVQWLLFKRGMAASNLFPVAALVQSSAAAAWPDLQLSLVNIAMPPGSPVPYEGHTYQIHLTLLRPVSRGTLVPRSPDPLAPPMIRMNYLEAQADREAFRNGFRIVRRVGAQKALAPYMAQELAPGAAVQTDSEIDAWLASTCRSVYHQCGTCRIGAPGDPLAVVDPELRVIGVRNLRIADASVMPKIPAASTAAPAIMIGEKAAAMIVSTRR